jgi:phosphate transport system substrate-binding protein
MSMKRLVLVYAISALFMISCQEKNKYGKRVDTPTTGKITIVADESLKPIVEAEVETFNALHKDAHISVIYLPEAEAISAMLNEDTIRMAIATRRLTKEEREFLMKETQIRAREEDLAGSGIALIANRQNPDSLITMDQIKDLLAGKINTWKQIGGTSDNGIEIVFDNPNSGLLRQMKDSVAKVSTLPKNCFAVKNNEAVVDHVAKNKNAIGLIGLEWVSDSDDTTAGKFLDKVRVMEVAGDSAYFKPYQAYLALKYYPLPRTITAINREGRTGLATGFAAFFASERGQRIILKAGLLPKTMPLRIVSVNQKSFGVE